MKNQDNGHKDNFFKDVYEVVRLIPKGKVTSYGAIAHYLGNKNKARQVGWAMNQASTKHQIPAHRVVNSKGILTGECYFNGISMQNLLEAEGIKISHNKIQNFAQVYWDPQKELL